MISAGIRLVTLAAVLLCGTLSATTRYQDSTYAFVTKDTIYGINATYDTTTQYLQMRVYEPIDDTLPARPVIVWMHGGGFTGGSYLDANCTTLCAHFAERGYVTATVEYRVGVEINAQIYNNFQDAIYRAVQDFKAAVRFLRKNASRYAIDPENIIIGGASAGGVTTMMYVFWDENELPDGITDRLGDFEASGTPGYPDAVAGAVPWAGCVGDTDMVGPVGFPVIALHDHGDPTVPFGYGAALGVPQLMVYGSGYPGVAANAGGNYHLVDFNNGDHIPTTSRYWSWIDSTRNNLYDKITGPETSGIRDAVPPPAVIPAGNILYTLTGRKAGGNTGRGIYLQAVFGSDGRIIRVTRKVVY